MKSRIWNQIVRNILYRRLSLNLWSSVRYANEIYPLASYPSSRISQSLKHLLRIYLFPIPLLALTFGLYVRFYRPYANIFEVLTVGYILATILYSPFFSNLLVASRTSEAIAREIQKKTYELLCLSPLGQLGTFWIIGASCLSQKLYRTNHYIPPYVEKRFFLMITYSLILLAASTYVAMLFLGIDIDALNTLSLTTWGTIFVYGTTTLFTLALEADQTPAIGTLIGMIVPTWIRRPFDAEVIALLLFVFVQMISYGIIYAMGFVLLPHLLESLQVSLLGEIALPIVRLVIFAAVRESTVAVLWRYLKRRLYGNDSEFLFAVKLLFTKAA